MSCTNIELEVLFGFIGVFLIIKLAFTDYFTIKY
ncbi:MAG: hypothetical protein ACJA0E_000598 [Bermanella sp.]|jgi:hypothetical protein